MSVVKLKDYRIAKDFEKDYLSIKKVLDLTSRGLACFKQYKPVMAILNEITTQKMILDAHDKVAKKILDKEEAK